MLYVHVLFRCFYLSPVGKIGHNLHIEKSTSCSFLRLLRGDKIASIVRGIVAALCQFGTVSADTGRVSTQSAVL